MTPNWPNKTVFVGDNLHVMRGMNSESVDLHLPRSAVQQQQELRSPGGFKGG